MTIPHFERTPAGWMVAVLAVLSPSLYFMASGFAPVWAMTPLQLPFFLAPAMLALWYWRARELLDWRHFPSRWIAVAGLSLVLAAAFNEALPFWNSVFPLPEEYADGFTRLLHPESLAGKCRDVFALALIPAVSEEFFFRGFLQTALMSRMRAGLAIAMTAALFSLYHLIPWYAPFYFLLGIFFGVITVRTRNLALAVTAHFVNNAVGLLYAY